MPKATDDPNTIRIADLCNDPALAAIFHAAERDPGLDGAEIDRPRPPKHDGAAVRKLELA